MPSQDEYIGIATSHLYKAKSAIEDACTIYVHETIAEDKPIVALIEELHWMQQQLDLIDTITDNLIDGPEDDDE